jgi:O-antigen/teichoic acid export membrane protein
VHAGCGEWNCQLNMSLIEKVTRGVSWNFASRGSSQVLQIAFSIVLARLLGPSEFGTIGMLVVFIGFAQSLADCGLSSALIYSQKITERHCSTIFWLQLAVGASLSVLFFVCAPLIAEFYSTPILEPLTRLASCIFLIQASGNIHSTLFIKEFQFRTLAIITVAATILSGITAIGLALHGDGTWALAWQLLAYSGVTTGLLWIQSKWRPRFVFDGQAAEELGRYGVYLLGHGSLNYWLRNADNLLIGKFLSAYQLGIYSRAYQLMLLPLSNVAGVVGQAIFPALAQLQDDLPRFKHSYFRATCMIALVSFPLMTGMAVLADPLILVLFGDKWTEVIPVIRVLSCVGLFQSIVFPVAWIFTALGKTRAQFKLSIVLAPPFIIAIGIGLHYGILGVAYGYAAWALFAGLLNLRIAGKFINLTASRIVLGVARIALMAGIMGIIVFSFDSGLSSTWPSLVRLGTGIAVGAASYLALCLLMKDRTFAEAAQLFFSLFDRSSSTA